MDEDSTSTRRSLVVYCWSRLTRDWTFSVRECLFDVAPWGSRFDRSAHPGLGRMDLAAADKIRGDPEKDQCQHRTGHPTVHSMVSPAAARDQSKLTIWIWTLFWNVSMRCRGGRGCCWCAHRGYRNRKYWIAGTVLAREKGAVDARWDSGLKEDLKPWYHAHPGLALTTLHPISDLCVIVPPPGCSSRSWI